MCDVKVSLMRKMFFKSKTAGKNAIIHQKMTQMFIKKCKKYDILCRTILNSVKKNTQYCTGKKIKYGAEKILNKVQKKI